MDTLDLRNLQLSYQAVYDDVLCESMEELGIIGEARDGYGDDSKFRQDTDASSFRPGKDVPKVKQYGRISRFSPMGGQRSRTQSNVTRTIGNDEGAPRAVKIAKEKPARKMVKKDGKWVKESQEFQLWINSLLDEGYDLSDYTLDEMVEIYEDRISDLQNKIKQKKASGATRRELSNLRNELQNRQRIKKGHKTWVKGGTPPQFQQENYDYYDIILEYLITEGYAETVENAEAIMVNMSEEWVGSIMEVSLSTAKSAYNSRREREEMEPSNSRNQTRSGEDKSAQTFKRVRRKYGSRVAKRMRDDEPYNERNRMSAY